MKLDAVCPECKHKFTDVESSSEPGLEPLPGDFTVCLHCGGILQFTADREIGLSVRSAHYIDVVRLMLEDLPTYQGLCRVQQAVLLMKQGLN